MNVTIIEQLARYIAIRLKLPFEGVSDAGSVFFGYLPAEPVKAVCVYADDLRAEGSASGTRVQIVIRSDTDGLWPLERGLEIMRLLDRRHDIMFQADGSYVNRIETDKGFEFAGMADNNTQLYAANFRIYYCC